MKYELKITMPAKRSNPKTMHRAGELRRELTPAERKLWEYLRGNKLNGVNFRSTPALVRLKPHGTRDTPLEIT
jgi:very-short-patch-repair endonuclease